MPIAYSQQKKHMKHNLLKSVILSVILLLGVNSVWGAEIYLKPNSNWTQSNARFAAYFFGNGEKWVSMTCYRDFYSVEVPSGFTKVIFCRMNPSTTANNWNNKWNQSGDLTIPTNGNNLFTVPSGSWDGSTTTWSKHTPVDQVVYLKPTDLWNKDGARFAAYAFNGCNNEWIDLDEIGCAGEYYTCTIPDKYHQVIFGRMVPNGTNGWTENTQIWNKSGDLTIDKGKCYTISSTGNGTGTAASGSWGTYTAPTYAITQNIGTGGTVTVSKNSNIAINEQVTVIISTSSGYTYKSGTIKIGTNTATNLAVGTSTHTICGPTTITAQWTENKYNVTINTDGNGTTNQTGTKQVGIVGINITATPNLGYTFKQWNVTGGAQVADKNNASTKITATAAGTVTAIFEEKPSTTIYLEPTGHWNADNPQFVAHVWNTSGNTDIPMTAMGEAPYKYYTCEVPYGYTNVLFYRKSTNGSTIWNQTNDLTIPVDNKALYEIKSTGDKTPGQDGYVAATGEWKDAYLFYTVTLGSSMFGPYGISYNGQSYFSKDDADVVINLPYGATINFIEGQPYSDIYTGGIMQSAPTKVPQLDLDQPFTVLSDVTFDDNYVTKVDQVAYLGVPNSSTWVNSGNANLIWRHDSDKGFTMYDNVDKGEYAFESNGVKYYKFNIKAGCNKFLFQRKNASTEADTHNTTETFAETPAYIYEDLRSGINCYMLDGTVDGKKHNGYWCTLPPQSGDYRLLYVEQVVEKDANNNTVITRKKVHPSDVVKGSEITAEGTIVSLHTYKERTYQAIQIYDAGGNHTYYKSSNNPEIILQRYDGSKWVDEECHMVFGPLETLPSMGMLPGRKNASVGSDKDDFVYDNGIDIIKNDTHKYQGSGVWNFYIIKNGTKITLDLNKTVRYEGKYYIRTDAAVGGWNTYTATSNHMGYSEISMTHSNYSHYFCKWISNSGTNVKYTIANDYGMAISDTLEADATDIWGTPITPAQRMVGDDQLLPASANVRYSWNEKTNFLHRAYLAGSGEIGNRFLVVKGEDSKILNADGQTLDAAAYDKENPRSNLDKNEEIFNDISNWVYYADVQLVPNAGLKVTAKYNEKVQYFVGQENNFNYTILAGSGSQKYLIRLLYDFKSNHLLSAYIPGGQADKEIEPIQTNLMLIRKENEDATQLTFTTNKMEEIGKRAYGVLELTQATLEDNTKNVYVRSLYWISFPFDVRITDIFGFGEYGKHWIIQSYDGAKRAANGLWTDSETNWVYHFDPNTLNAGTPDQGIMKRGVGYVVALNLNNIKADELFVGRINTLALYFPSTNTITNDIVNRSEVTIDVPAHACTINRPTPKGDRRIKDSHWNVIGVPSYINAVGNFGSINGKFDHIELENRPQQIQFYYRWLGDYDKYEVVATPSTTENFKSLTAYMVQYAGDLTWTSVLNEGPASLAAKHNSDEMKQHHLRLELQQNGSEQDRTFIQLQDEDVTANFDFNYDLCKIKNGGANIYSLIATDRDPIEVSGNALPVEETIIPLGIKLDAAGEYTFAMPNGTGGITAELIDYQTNTRTNLLLSDYTVNLTAGTNNTRFALHVRPDKTATNVEHITTPSCSDIRKFIIDGVLYMQKDGILYDAQGHIVR